MVVVECGGVVGCNTRSEDSNNARLPFLDDCCGVSCNVDVYGRLGMFDGVEDGREVRSEETHNCKLKILVISYCFCLPHNAHKARFLLLIAVVPFHQGEKRECTQL